MAVFLEISKGPEVFQVKWKKPIFPWWSHHLYLACEGPMQALRTTQEAQNPALTGLLTVPAHGHHSVSGINMTSVGPLLCSPINKHIFIPGRLPGINWYGHMHPGY